MRGWSTLTFNKAGRLLKEKALRINKDPDWNRYYAEHDAKRITSFCYFDQRISKQGIQTC